MTTKKKSAKPALGHILEPLRQFAVPLKSLKPDPLNTMSHDDRNIEEIMKSLSTFQQRSLLVVNAAGIIAKGNGTYEAAKRLGWTHIAAIRTDDAAAIHAAYSIADNKTGQLGKFDLEALAMQLKALEAEQVDLGITAFNVDEIAEVLACANRTIGQGDPDDVPAPPDVATTKPGDLVVMGDHRLLCGDSSASADVDRLLDGEPIHLVNTDPPYNVKVEPRSRNAIASGLSSFTGLSHHQGFDEARKKKKEFRTSHANPADIKKGYAKPAKPGSKMRPKDRPLDNDFVSGKDFDKMLRAWFGNMARVLEAGGGFYIWGGYANISNYPSALAECKLRFAQTIIWVKEHPVLTRKDFMGNHEWCFYGWKEGAAHRWYGARNIRDTWEVAETINRAGRVSYIVEVPADEYDALQEMPSDVWRVHKINPQSMVHLTEKPVELASRAMRYSSREGENVLDLFGGSGSTLIAAEQLKRRAFLMEIDPPYCDVIIQRWENFTGKQAQRP